ncbi:MAG: site-specific integrase, partial [Gammaproteobacteria bacterium]|nr:site-specific integrase [Gammaproteobacteria bacterium]
MESESASASLTLWIEQFLDHLANGRHLSPHSVKGYQRDLLHFHHYL